MKVFDISAEETPTLSVGAVGGAGLKIILKKGMEFSPALFAQLSENNCQYVSVHQSLDIVGSISVIADLLLTHSYIDVSLCEEIKAYYADIAAPYNVYVAKYKLAQANVQSEHAKDTYLFFWQFLSQKKHHTAEDSPALDDIRLCYTSLTDYLSLIEQQTILLKMLDMITVNEINNNQEKEHILLALQLLNFLLVSLQNAKINLAAKMLALAEGEEEKSTLSNYFKSSFFKEPLEERELARCKARATGYQESSISYAVYNDIQKEWDNLLKIPSPISEAELANIVKRIQEQMLRLELGMQDDAPTALSTLLIKLEKILLTLFPALKAEQAKLLRETLQLLPQADEENHHSLALLTAYCKSQRDNINASYGETIFNATSAAPDRASLIQQRLMDGFIPSLAILSSIPEEGQADLFSTIILLDDEELRIVEENIVAIRRKLSSSEETPFSEIYVQEAERIIALRKTYPPLFTNDDEPLAESAEQLAEAEISIEAFHYFLIFLSTPGILKAILSFNLMENTTFFMGLKNMAEQAIIMQLHQIIQETESGENNEEQGQMDLPPPALFLDALGDDEEDDAYSTTSSAPSSPTTTVTDTFASMTLLTNPSQEQKCKIVSDMLLYSLGFLSPTFQSSHA